AVNVVPPDGHVLMERGNTIDHRHTNVSKYGADGTDAPPCVKLVEYAISHITRRASCSTRLIAVRQQLSRVGCRPAPRSAGASLRWRDRPRRHPRSAKTLAA